MNVATKGDTNVLIKGNSNLITVNRIGNGLQFDMVNDYMYSPDIFSSTTDKIRHNTAWSYEGIFRGGYGLIVGNIYNITNPYGYVPPIRDPGLYVLFLNGIQRLVVYVSPSKYFRWEHNIPINMNKTNHVILTYTGGRTVSSFTLYINSEKILTPAIDFVDTNNFVSSEYELNKVVTTGVYFTSTSEYVSKYIYLSRFYNKTLTDSEAYQLFNSFGTNLTGLYSNIIVNYDFNQKQGNTIIDSSKNQIHATLANFGTTTNLGGGAWVDSLGNTITY